MNRKLLTVLIFFVIGIISLIYYKKTGGSICLFYNIYGFPCPTCGMTRAYSQLLHGNIKGAFNFHPLFWAVPFLILSLMKLKYFYRIGAVFIIVWLIRMFLFFPGEPPLDFNENAVFPKVYRMIVK